MLRHCQSKRILPPLALLPHGLVCTLGLADKANQNGMHRSKASVLARMRLKALASVTGAQATA
eukprot:1083196-Pleurochrysis_carterae.AAC.1